MFICKGFTGLRRAINSHILILRKILLFFIQRRALSLKRKEKMIQRNYQKISVFLLFIFLWPCFNPLF